MPMRMSVSGSQPRSQHWISQPLCGSWVAWVGVDGVDGVLSVVMQVSSRLADQRRGGQGIRTLVVRA